ncbi:MAG: hypothetical protein JNK25_00825 [Phycisphaerae bacterium]|nr:hypothetical protein [Phycisphaerae bacterium]
MSTSLGWVVVLLLAVVVPQYPAWHASASHACHEAGAIEAGHVHESHARSRATRACHGHPHGDEEHADDDEHVLAPDPGAPGHDHPAESCPTCAELLLTRTAVLAAPVHPVWMGTVSCPVEPPPGSPCIARRAWRTGTVRGPPAA